jgi:hypothetical protein
MTYVNDVIFKFYTDFQEYMYSNNIVVAASGWAMGNITYKLISEILSEFFIPLFITITIFIQNNIGILFPKNAVVGNVLHFGSKILGIFLFWFISIILSFVILEYFFNRQIIGLVSNVDQDKKVDFIKSKIESKKQGNILPNEKTLNDLKKREEVINDVLSNSVENYSSLLI